MASPRTRIEATILPRVAKPNRYIGNYTGADGSRFEPAQVRVAVLHPEVFEIGFVDRDTRAAHAALNALDGSFADLAFLPWPDLLEHVGSRLPLWALETMRPVRDFDLILFTPALPLQFVHVPRLLEASGLAIAAGDRPQDAPLVAAVGGALLNPLPLADFLDAAFLGEPEAVLPAVVRALAPLRGAGRRERLAAMEGLPGIVTSERMLSAASRIAAGHDAERDQVRPALLDGAWPRPGAPHLVPWVEAAEDGLRLEVRRGGRWPGHETGWRAFEPAWEMDPTEAANAVTDGLGVTGFHRVELTGDQPWRHSRLDRVAEAIVRRHPEVRIVLSDYGTTQPTPGLAREISRGRRTSYLWSPLAGSHRLARDLGSPFDEVRFMDAVATAKRGGCHQARFRFGIGWPGETEDDLSGLCRLVRAIRALPAAGAAQPRYQILLSPFVPRPHTPLEREGQLPHDELTFRISRVREEIESGPVHVRATPPREARIEAVIARGGRELGPALAAAARAGASTAGMTHEWDAGPWLDGLARAGIDPAAETGPRPSGTALPWSFIAPPAGAARPAGPAWRAPAPLEVRAEPDAGFGRRGRKRTGASVLRQAARYRLRLAKDDEARFTSHLDLGHAVERGLRRAGIVPASAGGRGARISYGPPLPLGMTSEDEYLDLTFTEEVSDSVLSRLGGLLPAGLRILDHRPIRASVESLSHAIDRAHYRISFVEAATGSPLTGDAFASGLESAVQRLLSRKEILVARDPEDEVNRINVRPGLIHAAVDRNGDAGVTLALHLVLGAAHAPRPETLLSQLGLPKVDVRLALIHRRKLSIAGAGREFSPLEVVELDFPWWRETMRKNAAGGGGRDA